MNQIETIEDAFLYLLKIGGKLLFHYEEDKGSFSFSVELDEDPPKRLDRRISKTLIEYARFDIITETITDAIKEAQSANQGEPITRD